MNDRYIIDLTFNSVDYKLLRIQKQKVLEMLELETIKNNTAHYIVLLGSVNFITNFQSNAIKAGISETEVYGE